MRTEKTAGSPRQPNARRDRVTSRMPGASPEPFIKCSSQVQFERPSRQTATNPVAAARFRSGRLTGQDRLMLAFFIPPIIVVTIFATYSRAFANWAAPSIVPAIVCCAPILVSFHMAHLCTGGGRVALKEGARTVVAEDRRTFNTLQYYLRDQPFTVHPGTHGVSYPMT